MEVKEGLKVTDFLDRYCKKDAWGRSYCLHLLNESQIRTQIAVLFYLSFSPFSSILSHTNVFASTHLGGDQSWLMSGFFRHCGRRPDSHLKTHSIFESAATIAFYTLHIDDNICISFWHFNFLLNCNNLLKMCCCKGNTFCMSFFCLILTMRRQTDISACEIHFSVVI